MLRHHYLPLLALAAIVLALPPRLVPSVTVVTTFTLILPSEPSSTAPLQRSRPSKHRPTTSIPPSITSASSSSRILHPILPTSVVPDPVTPLPDARSSLSAFAYYFVCLAFFFAVPCTIFLIYSFIRACYFAQRKQLRRWSEYNSEYRAQEISVGDSATSGWRGKLNDEEEGGMVDSSRGTVWLVKEDKKRPGVWWRSDTMQEMELGMRTLPRRARAYSDGKGGGTAVNGSMRTGAYSTFS